MAGSGSWGSLSPGLILKAISPGQIDMLQAEVTALKTLVITSTPASPNRELHPQLLSPTKAGPRKGHLRHNSTSSALCPAVCTAVGHTPSPDKEGKEVRGSGQAVVTVSQAAVPSGDPPGPRCVTGSVSYPLWASVSSGCEGCLNSL